MPEKPLAVLFCVLLPTGLLLVLLGQRSSPAQLPARPGAPRGSPTLEAGPRLAAGPLHVAGVLFEHPETGREMRAAIANAVALAAPVRAAALFLERHQAPELLAASRRLGSRPDGTQALRDRYYDLLPTPSDASDLFGASELLEQGTLSDEDEYAWSRAQVVAGLFDLASEELITIASEDPSRSVRAQAWMSLSRSNSFHLSRCTLKLLGRAFRNRDDPLIGLGAEGVLHAVTSFVSRGHQGEPELLPELRALVHAIAGAPETNERERACARRLLEAVRAATLLRGRAAPRSAPHSPV